MDYKILSISWDFLESFDSEMNLLVSIPDGHSNHTTCTNYGVQKTNHSEHPLQYISLLSPKRYNGNKGEFH